MKNTSTIPTNLLGSKAGNNTTQSNLVSSFNFKNGNWNLENNNNNKQSIQ